MADFNMLEWIFYFWDLFLLSEWRKREMCCYCQHLKGIPNQGKAQCFVINGIEQVWFWMDYLEWLIGMIKLHKQAKIQVKA